MTYAQFHFVFTIPVVVILFWMSGRRPAGLEPGVAYRWLAAICALAFVYTTPWDNYLVYRNVWGYPPERILATIGYVPVEEYFFFLIQSVMVGLLYFWLRETRRLESVQKAMPGWFRPAMVGYWLFWTGLGVACLLAPSDRALYAGLILAWACPVLAGLAAIGADKVWTDRRRVFSTIALASVYLWFADRTAIDLGIWWISDVYSLGIAPLGLPVEEAGFFVVTSALCATGLALFLPDPEPESRSVS